MNQPTPSMSADPIVALADSGTPGPWELGEIVPGVYAEHIPAYVDIEPMIAGGIDPADAAKIVAFVNAGPKVAALVAATQAHANGVCGNTYRHDCPGCCSVCGDLWPCPTAVARDELVAALGVDSE